MMKNNQENECNALKIVRSETKKYVALSCSQSRFWVFYKMKPDLPFCNCYYVEKLTGSMDIRALKKAIQFMVFRHETLRTNFKEINGIPVQIIHKNSKVKLDVVDLSRKKRNTNNKVDKEIKKTIRHPFRLEHDPLLRVKLIKLKKGKYIFIATVHHIIFDFWSLCIFDRELVELYNAFSQNRKPNLPYLSTQYRDYVEWERKKENSEDIKLQEKYWLEKMSGKLPVLALPLDKVRPAVQTFNGETETIELNKKLLDKITQFIRKNNITLFNFIFSAFSVFLYKLTSQTDIIIGVPTTYRDYKGAENVIGVFVNNLPVRIKVNPDQKFISVLNDLRREIIAAIENKGYPLEQLIEKLHIDRNLSRSSLFNVVCQADNRPEWVDSKWNKLSLKYQYQRINLGATQVDLRFFVIKENDRITLNLNYNSDIFYRDTIKQWMKYFKTLFVNILENPQTKLEDLEIITSEQKKWLINTRNKKRKDYFGRKNVHQLFQKQVEKTPNSIAVIFDDKKITYDELNKKANQLANFLISAGIKKGNFVPIFLENSIEIIVSMLAVLKSGGAFILLDTNTPKMRIARIIKDTSAKIAISSAFYSHKLKVIDKIIFIDKKEIQKQVNKKSKINLNLKISPEDLSSVVYTSSTTGSPKGVLVKHCNILKDVSHLINGFKLKSNCCLCHSSGVAYSVSLAQFFTPLLIGAKLFIYPKEITINPFELFKRAKKDGIKLLKTTPSLVNIFLDSGKKSELEWLDDLILVLTGEKIYESLIEKLNKLNRNIKIFSEYGQSECMTITKFYQIDFSKNKKILIGKPEDGCKVYILDEKLKPVPIGLTGGIYVSGADYIFKGYLNDSQKTKEVILPHPFIKGDVIYKTGDLGKMHPDGNIEYLGRADQQVQIRGNRVELEEIEKNMGKIPQIRQVLIKDKKEKNTDDVYLVAYYTAKSKLFSEELRDYLKNILPAYMIPSYFIQMDEFPLNANGKVDQFSLPELNKSFLSKKDKYQVPITELEKQLEKIWQEVLDLKKIGINDNFFDLGGHSLKVLQTINKISHKFKKQVSFKQFLENPTIKELAKKIRSEKNIAFFNIKPIEKKKSYDLSRSQIEFWRFDKTSEKLALVVYSIFKLEGNLNVKAFRIAIKTIINRHESLRTNFKEINNQPVQIIKKTTGINFLKVVYFKNNYKNQNHLNSITNKFIESKFILESDNLCRFMLIKINSYEWRFVLVFHHLIIDRWSVDILLKEISEVYNCLVKNKHISLRSLPLQYKDYASWENSSEGKNVIANQEKYWIDKFDQGFPIVKLPSDKRVKTLKIDTDKTESIKINKENFEEIKRICSEYNVTLFTFMLSVFDILLFKLTKKKNLFVKIPYANRNNKKLEHLVGLFVTIIPIKCDLKIESKFTELLSMVSEAVIDGFSNSNYSYSRLAEKMKKPVSNKDCSSNIFFQLFDRKGNNLKLDGLKVDFISWDSEVNSFDLKCMVFEQNEEIIIKFSYNRNLFNRSTIKDWLKQYYILLEKIKCCPTKKINELF